MLLGCCIKTGPVYCPIGPEQRAPDYFRDVIIEPSLGEDRLPAVHLHNRILSPVSSSLMARDLA